MRSRLLAVCLFVALGGCVYHTNERVDRTISDIASKPFDIDREPEPGDTLPRLAKASTKRTEEDAKPTADLPKTPKDVETANFLELPPKPKKPRVPDLTIPDALPGSEAPPLPNVLDQEELNREIKRLFPPLQPLPDPPKPQPGPDGRPYTLAMLQELAALNSPELKQALADVRIAQGAMIQARTYPNPTIAIANQPSNDGSTPSVWGGYLSQHIITAGKMKLNIAAAQKDLDNAELALKRARSDLATRVRSNYFGLLVAKESVRVYQGLAKLTQGIYQTQLEYGAFGAFYEARALRSQAYTARLALKVAINNYTYAWYQLVYSLGKSQLPLTEVAGRIDAHIPYFDYDRVLSYVAANHTDILTARNGLEKARYQYKLTQISPVMPDFDLQMGAFKEFSLQPFQFFSTIQISAPLPVWDRNRGNIIVAEGAMVRAAEEPKRAALALANNVQNAYNAYKNNIDTVEDYRKYILPDQVLAYQGVIQRRNIDATAQFGDVVAAENTLATSIAAYLTALGQLWTSTITLADFLQTDDLFALASPQAIPQLPDFGSMPPFPGTHPNQKPLLPPSKLQAIPRMSSEPVAPGEREPVPVNNPSAIGDIPQEDEAEPKNQRPGSEPQPEE